ncbi:MAG: CsbD family protein [Actinomycetota bacterium]|nr:CsbD family protein [Actinomycetota bacterium]PLS75856.1 MAG: CsbD family protein [Actinomycetota bacterium]
MADGTSGYKRETNRRKEPTVEKDTGPEAGAKGAIEEIKGRVKEAAGALVGDQDLEREGDAQQAKADAQREVAEQEARADAARGEAEAREAEQRSHQ